jgi:hypothetical protein
MNLKKLNPIRTLLRVIITLKKTFIIHRESRRRGGTSERNLARAKRFVTIKNEKYKIREDLVSAWALGEIARPTQEERDALFLYYHYLPWDYLVSVKKKYWNE